MGVDCVSASHEVLPSRGLMNINEEILYSSVERNKSQLYLNQLGVHILLILKRYLVYNGDHNSDLKYLTVFNGHVAE